MSGLVHPDQNVRKRNPEQLVQSSEPKARLLRVQRQQLPTESQVLEDLVLARNAAANMSTRKPLPSLR